MKILLRDNATYSQIEIGNNITFGGTTYIRVRSKGKIEIADNVSLGNEVWLVTANEAKIEIGEYCQIGSYCILNGGHGISIGRDSWFAAFIYLNSSDHVFKPGIPIRQQGYTGSPIKIGEDNWVGGHAFVNKGIETGKGCVIGAGSIVTKSFPENAVVVGNPAKVLKYRTDSEEKKDEN